MYAIRIFNAHPNHRIRHEAAIALIDRVLAGEDIHDASVDIIFIDDERMKKLNEKYLRHKYTTDVLSFPLNDFGEILEGEVYVNLDQSSRQAIECHASSQEERERLIVHGVLHLAGYRDKKKKDKSVMRTKEDFYLINKNRRGN